MPSDSRESRRLIGTAEVVDLSAFEPGEGPGFLLCVNGNSENPVSWFHIGGDKFEYPMEAEIPLEVGTYDLEFHVERPHVAPPALSEIEVRPGLGVVIIVTYQPPPGEEGDGGESGPMQQGSDNG